MSEMTRMDEEMDELRAQLAAEIRRREQAEAALLEAREALEELYTWQNGVPLYDGKAEHYWKAAMEQARVVLYQRPVPRETS